MISATQERDDTRATIAANFFRVAFLEHALPKLIYDPDTLRILEVNHAAEKIYGYTREELLRMSTLDIRPAEYVEYGRKIISTKNGARLSTSVHCTRNGKLLDVHVYSQLIDYGSGVARMVTITDAVAREAAVRESDQLLEIVLRKLPMVVWTTDQELRITWSDGAGISNAQLTPDEVLHMPISNWFGDDSGFMRCHRAALRGERRSCEVPFRDRLYSIAVEPLRDDAGQVVGVIGISLDVTDRAQAEASRHAQAEQFRALIEQSNEVLIIMDEKTEPRYASSSAAPVLGYTLADLIQAGGIIGITHPDDRPKLKQLLIQILAAPGQPITFETRALRTDGEWRIMECIARNMLEHAAINGIILNCRDITETRAAERRLRDSEDQLRQSQKLEAVGRLAGGIAHDFNNVLTAITGHADLLTEMFSVHDPRMTDVIEIRRAADRATALTRQLLAFSRRQVMQSEVIDMRTVVSDMERMLERLIGADITLQARVMTADAPLVLADLTQIEQVLLNLVINARDAMPTGGTLAIAVDVIETDGSLVAVSGKVAGGRYARLSVGDTGSGMPPELLTQIFEPFFTTKEQGRGTGLGLATVYGIVKQSDGYICVHSEVGAGTRFDILLPCVEPAATPCEAEPACSPATEGLAGTETILIVEDEPAVRSMAERVLQRHGYRVLSAANGDEALALAGHITNLSLVITDLIMPQMSGRELARRLESKRPDLRFLYMSGYSYGDMPEHDAFSEQQFLAKPFTADGLARKIREVLAA